MYSFAFMCTGICLHIKLPNPSSLSLLSKNTFKALPVSTFIFQRIHLTPNYCLCCSTSLLALLEFRYRYVGLTSLLMPKKHTTILLNHGHIQNKFVALLLPFCYLISRVLSFAVLARQYFPVFYFCDFSRQIWKKGIKLFWKKPEPIKISR